MTTIAVVRKNGYCAIAADTLTKWGSGKESAAYVANNTKIVKVGDSFLGAAGTATFKLILRDYFAQAGVPARFDSSINIFKTWQAFHAALKDRYYLVSVNEKDDSLEEIDWNQFFEIFEQNKLALLEQEETSSGRMSRFSKFVRR